MAWEMNPGPDQRPVESGAPWRGRRGSCWGIVGLFPAWLIVSACGETSPGAASTPPQTSGSEETSEPQWFYRATILADHQTKTALINRLDLVYSKRPTAATGPYVLTAFAGEELAAAAYLSFPTELRGETVVKGEIADGTTTPISQATSTVFIRYAENVTALRLYGDGLLLDQRGDDQLPRPSGHTSSPLAGRSIGTAWSAIEGDESPELAALAAKFPHIQFVTTDAALQALDPTAFVASSGSTLVEQVVNPSPGEIANLDEALSALPETLLYSIGSLSLARFAHQHAPNAYVAVGNHLVLNHDYFKTYDDQPNTVQRTFAHESAHCYQFLIDGDTDAAIFPVEIAERIQAVNPLGTNNLLRLTWGSAVYSAKESLADSKYGEVYARSTWNTLWANNFPNEAEAHKEAFTRQYGSKSRLEDFATHVEIFYGGDDRGADHPYCRQFMELDPSNQAIPYGLTLQLLKLNLLRATKIISWQQYDDCTYSQDPTRQHEGFMLGRKVEDSSEVKYLYFNHLAKAKAGQQTITADGTPHTMLVYQAELEQKDDKGVENTFYYYFRARCRKYKPDDSSDERCYPSRTGYHPLSRIVSLVPDDLGALTHFAQLNATGKYAYENNGVQQEAQKENLFFKVSINESKGFVLVLQATKTCVSGLMYNAPLRNFDDNITDFLPISWFRKGCGDSNKPTSEY
jgi:hypothetical protein